METGTGFGVPKKRVGRIAGESISSDAFPGGSGVYANVMPLSVMGSWVIRLPVAA